MTQGTGTEPTAALSRPPADAIEYLHAVAVLACVESGLKYRIERSDRSEAFYVKLFRPEADPGGGGGAWWGTRVACHSPVYACSRDYAQIHVPRTVAHPDELAGAKRALLRVIRTGGEPVADPDEVAEALFAAFRARRDGAERDGPAGTRWRWAERTLRWRLTAVDGVPAAAVPTDLKRSLARFAPPDAPDGRLPPREQSAIRHRLNRRARWAREECGAGTRPSRSPQA